MLDRIDQELNKREREQEKWLRSRPVCYYCDEPIQDESAHNLPHIGWICDGCLREYLKFIY